LQAGTTLLKALVAAGLNSADAERAHVRIERTFKGGERGWLGNGFEAVRILRGEIPDEPLRPGDDIQVTVSKPATSSASSKPAASQAASAVFSASVLHTTKVEPKPVPAAGAISEEIYSRQQSGTPVGANLFVDLDTGTASPVPPELKGKDSEAIAQWARSQGIDVLCEPNDDVVLSLVGLDLTLVAMDPKGWLADPSPDDMAHLDEVKGRPAFLAYQGKTHATALFRTREGGVGIVQIVAGISGPVIEPLPGGGRGIRIYIGDEVEDPKGLQIKHKMFSHGGPAASGS
jgi:hypothetical protein